MLRTTPAAPTGTTARVPQQPGAPTPPTRGRHRHQNHGEHGRVRTGVVVALSCGLLAAGTMFAVHLGLAAGRPNGPANSGPSAGAASQGSGALRTLQVLSVSPDNSADPLAPANPVRIVFSAPLTATSPLPTFSPALAGSWRSVGNNTIVFTPSAAVAPTTEETLLIPGGRSGEHSVTGLTLSASVSAVFQAGGWSTLRLEQLLAQLGYLPMTWNPQGSSQPGGTVATSYMPGHTVTAVPADGVLSWQSGYPAALTSQWQPGKSGVILTGALMAFEADHGLPMTGDVTTGLWQALLTAVERGQGNPNGYSFALVNKTAVPETITIWHNGKVVVHGPANTGAATTPTPDGTWPVYLRRPAQVMRGLYPDGKLYADPVQYVSFFNGDYAVHSMKRASYGTAQSLGCVELPLNEAKQAYPYLTYGSLVTVTGPAPETEN
ncbi:MAG TPA: L,D-transpeptidase family protein [Streptosporangiaceae bacterium]|nr:L,D-transpeptidase family protein [Streptosporangiaceae bacterium]